MSESAEASSERPNTLVLSYLGIRRAIGVSGLLLPVVLGPVGWIFGISFQDNMSSYYHTGMRDIFVGTLCAIGVFLLCYRGYGHIENWSANFACASAIGVALLPLDKGSDPLVQSSVVGYLHTVCGGVFFFTLAFYSLYHFPRDSRREEDPHLLERAFVFRCSGLVILIAMLAMGAYFFLIGPQWKAILNDYNFLFWMEWVAIWAFAFAWLAKGRTILADIAVDVLAYSREIAIQQIQRKRGQDPL